MIINHNISALNTFNKLSSNTKAAQSALEKLSSGLRINKAGDDAAGLAISEKMKAQVNGLDQASSNAQNGISLIQTAEGALSETQSILQRMNDLAVQATNDTNTDQDRTAIQAEVSQLTQEIDRIANTTQFNTKNLLNGGVGVNTTISGADAAKFAVLGGSADTQAGANLSVTAATAATTANTSTTKTSFSGASDTLAASSNLTVGGHSFTFAGGTTVQSVMDQINNASIGVTATLNGGAIRLDSAGVGSTAAVTISAATGDLAGLATAAGSNASVTITGALNTYTASGNVITMTGGMAKGLQFTVGGTSAATTTIAVNSNNGLNLQIGANEGQTMYVQVSDMRAAALGVDNIDLTTSTSAGQAITTINSAINKVSTQRATLGAYQNRLEHTINNLTTESENLQSAQSQITDVDMSKEMTEYTKNNILIQSATSMLAQANQLPNNVLSLLKG